MLISIKEITSSRLNGHIEMHLQAENVLLHCMTLPSCTTDLFCLEVLFSQFGSCDNAQANCFHQICIFLRIIYAKRKANSYVSKTKYKS